MNALSERDRPRLDGDEPRRTGAIEHDDDAVDTTDLPTLPIEQLRVEDVVDQFHGQLWKNSSGTVATASTNAIPMITITIAFESQPFV